MLFGNFALLLSYSKNLLKYLTLIKNTLEIKLSVDTSRHNGKWFTKDEFHSFELFQSHQNFQIEGTVVTFLLTFNRIYPENRVKRRQIG